MDMLQLAMAQISPYIWQGSCRSQSNALDGLRVWTGSMNTKESLATIRHVRYKSYLIFVMEHCHGDPMHAAAPTSLVGLAIADHTQSEYTVSNTSPDSPYKLMRLMIMRDSWVQMQQLISSCSTCNIGKAAQSG